MTEPWPRLAKKCQRCKRVMVRQTAKLGKPVEPTWVDVTDGNIYCGKSNQLHKV